MKEQAAVLFDPRIVEALTRVPYSQFIEVENVTI
jgi:hypothetical protein